MKILVIGDTHITEDSISELRKILYEEFLKIEEIDTVVHLGDLFHKGNRIYPTPAEIDFATEFVTQLKEKYRKVYILNGTPGHDKYKDFSEIEFLKHLGINCTVGDELELEGCLFGHFFVDTSKFAFTGYRYKVEDLEKKYKHIILGHQHSFQKLSNRTIHLGSSRYVRFDEAEDEYKYYAIINTEKKKTEYVGIANNIKMINIEDIDELPNISANSKVCMVIKDWNKYKEWINRLPEFKKKFIEFKVKLDYQKVFLEEAKNLKKSNKNKSLQDILREGLANIKDENIKAELEQEFKEEGLI